MKKFSLALAAAFLGATFVAMAAAHPAYAARKKVDCAAIMKESDSGKKPKEIAKDLKVPVRRVYYCRGKAKKAAKAAAAAAKPAPASKPAPAPASKPAPAPAPASKPAPGAAPAQPK